MLRRDRQIRMQIHQLVDVFLFAFSFWLAFQLRTSELVIETFGLIPFEDPFSKYLWFYLALIVVAPLILESQGFYDRPMICPRRATLWPLFKGCFYATVALIAALFLFNYVTARTAVILFGFISFALIYLKEEVQQWLAARRLARGYKRRFILIG